MTRPIVVGSVASEAAGMADAAPTPLSPAASARPSTTDGPKFILRLSVAIVSVVMSGCALFNRDVVLQSVEFNDSLATAANKGYLSNILRAMDHEPMLLTTLTTVRGNLKLSATTGDITVPFGGGSDNKYGIAPKVTAEINPSFDMSLLDGAKFYRGFLHPVENKVVNYYVDQGWSEYFLLMLLVRRIEIPKESFLAWLPYVAKKNADGTWIDQNGIWTMQGASKSSKCKPDVDWSGEAVYVCTGDPMSPVLWRGYEAVLTYLEVGLRTRPRRDPMKYCIGPQFDSDKADEIAGLYSAGFEIVANANKTKYCVVKARDSIEYRWGGFPKGSGSKLLPPVNMSRADSEIEEDEGLVFVRSPEALMYFLGEVVRRRVFAQQNKKKFDGNPGIFVSSAQCTETLFRLEPIQAVKDAEEYMIKVEHKGKDFGVPFTSLDGNGCMLGGGRTMHVLTLVNQLVGLFKEKDELSVTPSVLAIN